MGSVDHLFPKTHVIGVISNPVRYESRYRLAQEFIERLPPYANFWLVEAQQGDREFILTDRNNPRHIQLRTIEELWIKENMQNIAVREILRQCPDAEYLITSDMDIQWVREDWLEETIQQLQNYNVVQCFQTAHDLGPDGGGFPDKSGTHNGFAYSYVNGLPYGQAYHHWHPGFAWGWCVSALYPRGGGGMGDALGGPFISGAILGAADHHMALAMIGKGRVSYHGDVSDGYKRMVDTWNDRAERNIFRDIGYVSGTIYHHWHGKKKNRFYQERWSILTKDYPGWGKFDPYRHLIVGPNGLYMIDNAFTEFRDAVRAYFRSRNEDSIDLV